MGIFFSTGADDDFVLRICFRQQQGVCVLQVAKCSETSVDDVECESSSKRSLSDADVRHGDDEHSDAHVKFVELEGDDSVCVAALF